MKKPVQGLRRKTRISRPYFAILTFVIGLSMLSLKSYGQCSFDFMNETSVFCAGGADGTAEVIATTANPPFTYMWNDPGAQTTQMATGLVAGAYQVSVSDNAGCSFTEIAVIFEPTPVNVTVGSILPDDCGTCTGSVSMFVTGGTAPYIYEWSNGVILTATQTGLCAGNYCFSITDANGCLQTSQVTVSDASSSLSATVTIDNGISCFGNFDGQATVNATGGVPPYDYLWFNGENTMTAASLPGGQVAVTVVDNSGCFFVETCVEIPAPSEIQAITQNTTPAFCNDCDGSAMLTVFGGSPPYDFLWNNGSTEMNPDDLCPGVYNPTITDQLGCSVVHTVIIGSTSLHMVDSVTIDQPISCFGASDAIVTVHTSGGTPPYSYDWPFGGTDATQSGLSTGSYSFTVFDNTGCPTNGVVSILEPSELLATTVVATNVACFGEDDGQAQVLATGGTPPYTYQWDNGDTDQTSTNLNANLHVVTVTDNNLCTTTSTVTISEPTMLSLFIQNNNDPSCNAGSDGSATAFVGGGVPPYDYAWSHGETTQTATALANSIYSVTVTDANGCTATEETAINEPPILEISDFFIMEPLCFGGNDGSIDIDVAGGTPPFAFVWETQGITIATTEEITNIPTGTYSVTVTDDNGCATTASDNMNEPTELQVFVTNVQQNTCGNMDGAIDIAITGGTPPYFYNWSTGDTAQNLDGLGSGFYTVWVNDFNGCVAIADNILISDTDGPTIDLGADIQICIGDPVQMNPTISGVSGNETYFWFPPGLFDDPNIPNPVLTITQDTTVIFGINDGNCTVLDELFIEVYNISVSAQMTNPAGCPTGSDGVIEVIATGGVQPYSFSLDLTDWQASNIFSGLSPGTYVVYVTDAFGCLTQTLVDVTPGPDVPPLVIAIPPQFNSIYTCDDMLPQATVTLFLSGGLPFESQSNYLITVSGTTLGDDVVDDPFPGMVGGDVQYTFDVADGDNWIATVTDETGCSSDMILDLFEYSYDCLGCTDPFDVTADAGVDQLVCGNEAVQIGGFPAGTNTTGGETYAWTPTTGLNDATMPNPMASVSTTTVYTLVVTDQNGCIATDDVIVLHNPEMSIFDTSTTNPLCHDSVDGMIDFDQSGGTPPFSYIWTGPNGFTSESAPPLIALEQGASYCVTITDALGCDVSECFAISGPPQLNVSFSAKDDCGDSDGWAFAFVTGGIGTFTYNWSTGESTANINGLDSGIYDLTVTDENNCSLEASVQIFETDCVWAGDANYDGIANNDDVLALGIANGQTGPNRTFNFPEWIGVPADDWSGNFMDGVNYKHADCDGNGIVNQDDTLAISINYNMTHTVNFSPQGTPGAPPLTFEIEPDTVGPSTQVRIDIHYGEMTQQVNNLYGIALTVDYDADLVVPGSVYCDFSQSWIGDANETVWLSKELNGLVDIAISRTDQANVDGFGLIGTIYMVIEDNVDGFAPMDDVEMYLNFLDVNAISFDESEIPYSLTQGVLVIDPELTSTINPWLEEQVEVFPNPATENIHIEISNVNLESLQMFDILGREIQVVVDSRGQLSTIDITGIENGTYLVRVNTYEGSVSRRIVIAR